MSDLSRKRTRDFLKHQRGASAVEFALVAPIFFALIFAVLEVGYFFFVESAVTEATAKASRLIRTGQAQNGIEPDDFFKEICNVVQAFGSCEDRLTVQIANFNDFTQLDSDPSRIDCRSSSNTSIAGSQFTEANYGRRRDIVRVRVCYLHRPVNPALGLKLPVNTDGFKELISVSVFRNEPFEN